MTIRHLKIFIAVAEAGTMSAAAEKCFLSQPTVSQAIRELEAHYGVLLFDRLSKKLYITEAGKNLLAYARRTVSQFQLLETSMEEYSSVARLRIGATITIGSCLLSSVLNDLKARIPDIQTYACVTNTSQIEAKLLDSELDIGLVEGRITSPELVCIPVAEDFLVLAMAASHPLAAKEQIQVQELAHLPFVMREKGSGTRRLFEEYMNTVHVPYEIAWEANCPEAIKNAVLYNGCICAISFRLLEKEVGAGSIHVVRNLEDEWKRSFYLVYHKDRLITPAIKAVQAIMEKYKTPDFLHDVRMGILTRT